MSTVTRRVKNLGKTTHPDGIVARSEAHFVSERPAGDAAVSTGRLSASASQNQTVGAGHVTHRIQGEAQHEVVGV